MAGDDDRPVSDVLRPLDGKPGDIGDPAAAEAALHDPLGQDEFGAERPAPEGSAFAASEPTMADAGADLAASDRPAERFAPIPGSPTQEPKRSMMPALLAAIGLVLIALLGLNLYMMANPPGQEAIPALQADLTATKGRLAALEKRPAATTDLAPLEAQVKTLDASVSQMTAGLDETRAEVAALPVVDPAAGAATAGKLDALDKHAAALDGAVVEVKQSVAALPKVDLGPLQTAVAGLQANDETLKAGLAAIPKVDLSPLEAKTAALDARLKPMETEYAVSRTRAAPLALTAQGILLALDEGKPFPQDLAALKALGVDDGKLTALGPVASTGAPTQGALVAGFADLRPALVEAAAPVKTGTMFDRMMASAQSVVKVRAAGASAGNDPDAIASRIAAALDAGAYGTALTEWDRLPDAGKAVSAAWAAKLKQRVAAGEAAQAIASSAIASLSTPQ